MIIEDPSTRVDFAERNKFIQAGVLVDTNVLIVYFLDRYSSSSPSKKYVLKDCHIENGQITCLNAILQNFRIKKFIITPHVFSEFLNRIRNDLKSDYKLIKKEILEELKQIDEMPVSKNSILAHEEFIDFGNDISLLLASEKHLSENRYSAMITFDGRFINKFFTRNNQMLVFNMEVLSHFFN